MGKLTLNEFLERNDDDLPKNAYVRSPGFAELYVRYGRRYVNKQWIPRVLDIARATARKPGRGAFTKLVQDLLARGIPIYVECVLNKRMIGKLQALGFDQVGSVEGAPNFFKAP